MFFWTTVAQPELWFGGEEALPHVKYYQGKRMEVGLKNVRPKCSV